MAKKIQGYIRLQLPAGAANPAPPVGPALGAATTRNFAGPLQTIIPAASNAYTEALIAASRDRFGADFWGFWMLGGMSGGGMGMCRKNPIRFFTPAARRNRANGIR